MTYRFLCDEMLKQLAHWLRAAGYDTLMLADRSADRLLFETAREEGRLLLTRDRQFKHFARSDGIVRVLECNGLEGCAEMVTTTLQLDWQYQPFSRCLVCNTPLQTASSLQRQQLPVDIRTDEWVLFCAHCEQLFWEGGHVKRMRAQLTRWSQGHFLR